MNTLKKYMGYAAAPTMRPDGMPEKGREGGIKKKALFPIGETYEISVTPLAGLALADAEPEDEGEEVLGTGVRKEAS
jgi:hypothetical protein